MNEHTTATAHLMVVEDDAPTRELLCDHLEADKFEVEAADGLEQARTSLEALDIDLVLLDLTLPDGQAATLLKEVHEQNPEMGLIVVSGRGTERDRVRALTSGADDYIQKPFSYSELLARINAVLRRRRGPRPVIKTGAIEINTVEKTVKVAGRDVLLSQKEFALLTVMAAEPSRVFSKAELLQEVWGYRSTGHTRTLDAHCSRLRRKLEPDHATYVVPCWGVGYRLQMDNDPVKTKDEDEGKDVSSTPFTVIGYSHKHGAITLSVVSASDASEARTTVESKTDTEGWEWRANFKGDVRNMALGTGDDIDIEVID